jgi:hypothetical protein
MKDRLAPNARAGAFRSWGAWSWWSEKRRGCPRGMVGRDPVRFGMLRARCLRGRRRQDLDGARVLRRAGRRRPRVVGRLRRAGGTAPARAALRHRPSGAGRVLRLDGQRRVPPRALRRILGRTAVAPLQDGGRGRRRALGWRSHAPLAGVRGAADRRQQRDGGGDLPRRRGGSGPPAAPGARGCYDPARGGATRTVTPDGGCARSAGHGPPGRSSAAVPSDRRQPVLRHRGPGWGPGNGAVNGE